MKYLLTWNMTLRGTDGTLIDIGYPRSISFMVTRGTMINLPQATIRIYNLSKEDRENIFKDYFDSSHYNEISLRAGYENEPTLPEIFRGNILQAYNYREGVDWITEIQAMDGIYAARNGQISLTVPTQYNAKNVLKQIIQTMPRISIGAIGSIVMDNTRGRILFGNSWSEALKFSDGWGTLFIDKEQVHFLNDQEYIDDGLDPIIINSNSGLLRSPKRQDERIDIEVLFSPEIEAGRAIILDSLEGVFNGFYIVRGVNHRASISRSVAGSALSTLIVQRADPVSYKQVLLPSNSAFANLAAGNAA